MTYYRVRLTGSLRTLSELHIGSGELIKKDAPPSSTEERKSEVSTVLVDADGKPYIPASTLRGFLRSQLSKEQAEVLFGYANQSEEGMGMSGLVRIYDARWQSYSAAYDAENQVEPPTITRTSIDPVTQTAKQHSLYSQEFVPIHTCFTVELEIDQRLTALRTDHACADLEELDETLIQALLNALAGFNKDSLGQGKSVGLGRLEWKLDTLAAITLAQLKTWAQAKNKLALETCYQSIQAQFNTQVPLATDWQLVPFQLQATAPLLINNPDDTEAKNEEVGAPKQIFLKRLGVTNQAVIPASTLKGWCRAQCRRILLTLTQNKQVDTVDSLLQQLFGSTDQVGVLRFYDATVSYTEGDIHLQTFNAVDRFTGGVKEGALYSVKALYPKTTFEGQVAYQGTLDLWMQWLLLLVWRDAEEGDLVLGSDKAKGYGQLILKGFKQGAQAYFAKHQAILQLGANELAQKLHRTTGTGAAA